jgi:molecular chaperone GrpE
MGDITEQTIDEQSPSPGADALRDDDVRQSAAAAAPALEVQDAAADADAGEQPAAADEASEVEGDIDELVRIAAERDEYLALAQRTQADFENYRKRVARDSAAAQGRGVASLAKELLPALDNLDRALEEAGTAAKGGGQGDALLEGGRAV